MPEVNKLSVDDYFKYVAELMKTNPHREATALPLRGGLGCRREFTLFVSREPPPAALYKQKRPPPLAGEVTRVRGLKWTPEIGPSVKV